MTRLQTAVSVVGWCASVAVAEAGGAAAAVGLRVLARVANTPVLGDVLFGKAELRVDEGAVRLEPDLCPYCGPGCRCL